MSLCQHFSLFINSRAAILQSHYSQSSALTCREQKLLSHVCKLVVKQSINLKALLKQMSFNHFAASAREDGLIIRYYTVVCRSKMRAVWQVLSVRCSFQLISSISQKGTGKFSGRVSCFRKTTTTKLQQQKVHSSKMLSSALKQLSNCADPISSKMVVWGTWRCQPYCGRSVQLLIRLRLTPEEHSGFLEVFLDGRQMELHLLH